MNEWIQIKNRKIRVAAISAIAYNKEKHELRIYENTGYTSVIITEEQNATKLEQILAHNKPFKLNLVLKLK